MLALFLAAWTALAAPEPVAPTDAEWQKIQAGEVVTRLAPELEPSGAYGWVEIKAQPDTIWAVLNDPAEAAAASGAAESVETYVDEPTEHGRKIGLHYVLNVAWTKVEYHVLRDFRPGEGWMTWTLDPAKQHDLVHTSGHYMVAPSKTDGALLLSYKTQVDSGRNVPQWIQNLLTGKALKGYLGHVKKIAETR